MDRRGARVFVSADRVAGAVFVQHVAAERAVGGVDDAVVWGGVPVAGVDGGGLAHGGDRGGGDGAFGAAGNAGGVAAAPVPVPVSAGDQHADLRADDHARD